MSPEVSTKQGREMRTDALVLLQQGLDVSPEVAASLATVQVACPVPGEGRDSSLGEFLTSEHGADKATTILATAREALESGAEPDEALHRALGFVASKDVETGKLVRVPVEDKPVKKKT